MKPPTREPLRGFVHGISFFATILATKNEHGKNKGNTARNERFDSDECVPSLNGLIFRFL